ncbi:male-enhanced antigen 1-like [Branchiostoma lanceolatum]|uniref:male-enhanced antigen 1-like n=1 Tax=Branchiostoma lanceolatum TaxID=7740 RepID=UPI003451EEA8
MPLNDGKMNWPQNGPDDQVRSMVTEIPQPASSDDESSDGGSEDESIDPAAAAGYQLLPQDPETVPSVQPEPTQHNQSTSAGILLGGHTSQGFPIPDAPHVEHDDFIIAADEDTTCQQPMQPEHAELVKSVMAGFQLPSSAIPRWAEEMPEDQWKAAVMSHIGKSDDSDAAQAEGTVSSQRSNQPTDNT